MNFQEFKLRLKDHQEKRRSGLIKDITVSLFVITINN